MADLERTLSIMGIDHLDLWQIHDVRTREELRAIAGRVHDLALARRFADRLLLLHEGRLVADAPPAEALSAPNLAAVFGLADGPAGWERLDPPPPAA